MFGYRISGIGVDLSCFQSASAPGSSVILPRFSAGRDPTGGCAPKQIRVFSGYPTACIFQVSRVERVLKKVANRGRVSVKFANVKRKGFFLRPGELWMRLTDDEAFV